jgi:hypothetical protein
LCLLLFETWSEHVGASTIGATSPPPVIVVDPAALGLPFDGIGGVNGGNGARLLANYPQPQRDAVLDLLFSPQVGCALNILKVRKGDFPPVLLAPCYSLACVCAPRALRNQLTCDGATPHSRLACIPCAQVEIGADGLAANAGGEQAIRHTPSGPLGFNGTNFFLMREAAKRNPNITLYGLPWSMPGWFSGRDALGHDQANLAADWCDGVREVRNLCLCVHRDTSRERKHHSTPPCSGHNTHALICHSSVCFRLVIPVNKRCWCQTRRLSGTPAYDCFTAPVLRAEFNPQPGANELTMNHSSHSHDSLFSLCSFSCSHLVSHWIAVRQRLERAGS